MAACGAPANLSGRQGGRQRLLGAGVVGLGAGAERAGRQQQGRQQEQSGAAHQASPSAGGAAAYGSGRFPHRAHAHQSAAGARCPGTGAARTTKNTGTSSTASSVGRQHAAEHAGADGALAGRAGATGQHQGMTPSMKASEVIRMGLKRADAQPAHGPRPGRAARGSPGELDDQHRVLAARPMMVIMPTWK